MRVVDGQLLGPDPQLALDGDSAIESLKKLAQRDVTAVICYHGGLCRDSASERIAELA